MRRQPDPVAAQRLELRPGARLAARAPDPVVDQAHLGNRAALAVRAHALEAPHLGAAAPFHLHPDDAVHRAEPARLGGNQHEQLAHLDRAHAVPPVAVPLAPGRPALAAMHAADALAPYGRLPAGPVVMLAASLAARGERKRRPPAGVAIRQHGPATGHEVHGWFRAGTECLLAGCAQCREIDVPAETAARRECEIIEHNMNITTDRTTYNRNRTARRVRSASPVDFHASIPPISVNFTDSPAETAMTLNIRDIWRLL